MKYVVCSILLFLLGVGISHAQERGIGVSPAKIEIGQNTEWPYTVPITVTNFSAESEQFEVFGAAANPGRFSLDAGASRRVLLTFEEPRQGTEGLVKVVSMKESDQGFKTGTGVKIPFRIEKQDSASLLAGAAAASGGLENTTAVYGALTILGVLAFLWRFSLYARKFFRV